MNCDTRHLFRDLTSRKPSRWATANRITYANLTSAQRAALVDMPHIALPVGHGTFDDHSEFSATDITCEFLVHHDGEVYYVNTEGYLYARYVLRIRDYPVEVN